MLDYIQPFQLEKANARGRIIQLDSILKEIRHQHQYPAVVDKFLSELVILGVLISDMFKFEGYFTLQTMGEGPISMLVVDITSDKNIRACARFDEEAVRNLNSKDLSVPHVLGGGYLAYTIDQAHEKDRFQGIVALTGQTLAECVHHYFHQSEQIEVGVFIATDESEENKVSGGGILIQQLPEGSDHFTADEEDSWFTVMSLLSTLSKEELLSEKNSSSDILYKLFWQEEVRIFDPKPLRVQCRCSEEKTLSMLKTFSEDDLRHMLQQHMIEVTCEFCSKKYHYSEDEVNAWIEERRA